MLFNRERALRLMKDRGVGILIASTPENVTYVTDFWSWGHWCLKGTQTYAVFPLDAKANPYIVTPISEMDQAAMEETCWIRDFVTFGTFYLENPPGAFLSRTERNLAALTASAKHKSDAITALAESLQERGLSRGKIALDGMNIPPALWQALQKKLPDVEWADGHALLRDIRAVKTAEEVKRLEESIAITEKAFLRAIEHLREGATERDVARAYTDTLNEEGAVSILTCIGAGVRSGFPNVIPGDSRVQKGDLVRFDIGCVYRNYYSDTARIAVLGKPTAKQHAYYQAVKLGEDRGLGMMRPGTTAKEVFTESVQGVREAGIPHYKRGHVGHGIGIECYDIPSLSPVSGHLLEEGMVLNIETPYYELGFGGVQVEDTLVVTKDGYRLLTKCDRDLFVL